MKKYFVVLLTFTLILTMIGCSAGHTNSADLSEDDNQTQETGQTESSNRSSAPTISTPSGDSTDDSASAASESSKEPDEINPNTEPNDTSHIPPIDGSSFYSKEGNGVTFIWDERQGAEFYLEGDVAKEFYAGLSFSKFTPVIEEYSIVENSSDPCIQFSAGFNSNKLIIDKNTGIAKYMMADGSAYFYSYPAEIYDEFHNYIVPYFDKYYEVRETEMDADGNWNV